MLLVVASLADEASVTIRDALLGLGGWLEFGAFEGRPAWRRGDRILVTIPELHLDADDIDRRVAEALSVSIEAVVFVSKHRAASGTDALTVHPIGNWHRAEFGGREGEVVPAAPGLMTDALRRLSSESERVGLPATFEATHHGPYLTSATFYIEVGSGPPAWSDPRAASAIARTVADVRDPGDPVAIGVGGGHYVPRMTDVALSRHVAFGHLIPSYALDPPNWRAVEGAIERTPGIRRVYFHRKALDKALVRQLDAFFRDRGVEPAREADFSPRGGPSERI